MVIGFRHEAYDTLWDKCEKLGGKPASIHNAIENTALVGKLADVIFNCGQLSFLYCNCTFDVFHLLLVPLQILKFLILKSSPPPREPTESIGL